MYTEEEVRELIRKALTHNDHYLCGSLITRDYETIKRNNTAVGQKFDVPTRIVYSMDFVCKNI